MSILISVLFIGALLGLFYLLSNDKKNVNFKAVGIMLGLQVILTLVMFKTTIGMTVLEAIANAFSSVMSYASVGINFVVGGIEMGEGGVFFINVLMVVIFVSVLLSVLTHFKILPLAIKYIGGGLSKITGLPRLETFHAVNSIFFGQSEALLALKGHIPKLGKNRLFVISTTAMASVSASIVASYMTMMPAKYILVAMLLNALSALVLTSLISPVVITEKEDEINVKEMSQTKSVFEAIAVGAIDGGKVALIVAAMLVAYLSLLAMINGIMNGVLGFDLSTVFGYVFAPIAWLMGVPAVDITAAGSIMGTKLLANEFTALLQFSPMIGDLAPKTVGIISTFLTSFAAFGSIGIVGGAMQAINGEKASIVAKFGLKMLAVATVVSILSATIVGLFI